MEKRRFLFALPIFALSALACGDLPPGFEDDSPAPRAHAENLQNTEGGQAAHFHSRFVGTWMVDQPTHATYEATFYTFESDGTLLQGTSHDWGGHLERHGETGSVARAETFDPACTFGEKWHSENESTLVIAGDCSDGTPRDIVLGFDDDPSNNAEWGGATVKIVSVGGETDWVHDNWPWMFRKCGAEQSEEECMGWEWAP
jgi:hypothetical protein